MYVYICLQRCRHYTLLLFTGRPKHELWALYNTWEELDVHKILPKGVGTLCASFWQISFLIKELWQAIVWFSDMFLILWLSSIIETQFYRQHHRSGCVIISWFCRRRQLYTIFSTKIHVLHARNECFDCLHVSCTSLHPIYNACMVDLLTDFGTVWSTLGLLWAALWGPIDCPLVL